MPETFEPWDRAIAAFLADLTGWSDRSVAPAGSDPDRATPPGSGDAGAGGIPPELRDLPEAASRVLARLAPGGASTAAQYPSIDRALHEVVIAEVIADRLERRARAPVDLDALVATTAATLDYFAELAVTSVEGLPVTHGVCLTAETPSGSVTDSVDYPGRLPTRKRTPLLFDGTQCVLVVDLAGRVLRSIERTSLPAAASPSASLRAFDELPGIDGGLTAAASAAFGGVGVYLREDRSILIFDEGTLLFVRRGLRWRSVAFEAFTRTLTALGNTSPAIGQRVARAALRLSMQGRGGILAISGAPADLRAIIHSSGPVRYDGEPATASVDDDLSRMLHLPEITTASGLVRLARLDGATVIDTRGDVLAYGAIVRSDDPRGEGARTAAARTLSTVVDVALSISHDGPITVYHRGHATLELL